MLSRDRIDLARHHHRGQFPCPALGHRHSAGIKLSSSDDHCSGVPRFALGKGNSKRSVISSIDTHRRFPSPQRWQRTLDEWDHSQSDTLTARSLTPGLRLDRLII